MNEELPASVGKMAFKAREAKRKGLISKCKATPMGLTVTTLENNLVEVDNLDELFDLLSDLSEAAAVEEEQEMETSTAKGAGAGVSGNVPEINMPNEVLL